MGFPREFVLDEVEQHGPSRQENQFLPCNY